MQSDLAVQCGVDIIIPSVVSWSTEADRKECVPNYHSTVLSKFKHESDLLFLRTPERDNRGCQSIV